MSRHRRSLVLLGSTAAFLLAVTPPSAADLIARPAGAAAERTASGAVPVEVDASLLAAEPEALWLELAPGEGGWAYRTELERTTDGGSVWRGRFAAADFAHSGITLSLHDGLLIGTFQTPEGSTYRLEPAGSGGWQLRLLESDALPCGVVAGEAAGPESVAGQAEHRSGAAGAGGTSTAVAGDEREISILVLYTPRAAQERAAQQIHVLARHNVDLLNSAFANSGIDGRAVLAAAAELDLGLTTPLPLYGDVMRLAIEDPKARALQDRWAADVVSIVISPGDSPQNLCGFANVMTRGLHGPQMANRAYNVINIGCFARASTFVHEVGHNLGAQHDPAHAMPRTVAVFPFAYGHGVDGAFRTVVTNPNACRDCTQLHGHFSSPLILVDGQPTGVAGDRDNALALNMTIPLVASFRTAPRAAPPPAAPSQLTAAAPSPTEVELAWTDNAGDETGFEVQSQEAQGTTAWRRVALVPSDSTSHTVGGLAPATSYLFRVRATGAGPPSAWSAAAAATTTADAPTALEADPLSSTQVRLRWQGGGGAMGFEVEVRGADPAEDRAVGPLLPGPDGVVVGGLTPDNPYTFRVRELLTDGPSMWSPPASATTQATAAGPCVADESTLCLLGGRFATRSRWRNPRPPFGHGIAAAAPAPGSDQAGFFTFFDLTNVELVVKLLDGRSVNGAFWAFYGALSDVEYWITVRDTADGSSRTYHNPPFEICGRGDTAAFSGGAALSASAASSPPLAAVQASGGRVGSAAAGDDGSACTPGPEALCLAGGRFRVEVAWENPHQLDDRGVGRTLAGTGGDQSGHFWFFHPANPELSVKILDGRALNGHFWIFWGGLSDVGYTIEVTDTESGTVDEFVNPPLTLCGGAVTDRLK